MIDPTEPEECIGGRGLALADRRRGAQQDGGLLWLVRATGVENGAAEPGAYTGPECLVGRG